MPLPMRQESDFCKAAHVFIDAELSPCCAYSISVLQTLTWFEALAWDGS